MPFNPVVVKIFSLDWSGKKIAILFYLKKGFVEKVSYSPSMGVVLKSIVYGFGMVREKFL